jgi:transcriptional regulator with XRE-family HTH domain
MPKLVLKQILKKRKISKYRFARLMGEDSSNAARYFREGYDPRFSTIVKWAKALKIKVTDLIKG